MTQKVQAMTRHVSLLLLLLATLAAAQPVVTRGGALKKKQYQTYAAMTLYVDPTGSDSGSCTGTGTAACATLPGALAKVPKIIRHVVTVNIAAGTYALASNYTAPSFLFSDAGQLLIQGTTWSNITPATGSATGTVTSYTAGVLATATVASIVDSGQAWTADALKGSYVTITSGASSGTSRVIVGNTATTINITGTITNVSAGTTYSIQRPAAIITGTPSAGNALITFSGLSGGTTATTGLFISDLTVDAGSGSSGYALRVQGCHIATGFSTTGQTITFRRSRIVGPTGLSVINKSDVAFSTNTTYFEGTFTAGLIADNSLVRDTGGYVKGAAYAANFDGSAELIGAGVLQWPVYEGGSSVGLYFGQTSVGYTSPTKAYIYAMNIRGAGCLATLSLSFITAVILSCTATSGTDIAIGSGSYVMVQNVAPWSGVSNALNVDGDIYTSATVEALSPRRIVGISGSTFLRFVPFVP